MVVPAFSDLPAMGSAVFGVATWIVPSLRYALQSRKKPKTSFAAVGRVLGFVVLAGCFSAIGFVLAFAAIAFAANPPWAWFGVGTIVGFWLSLGVVVAVSGRRSRGGAS